MSGESRVGLLENDADWFGAEDGVVGGGEASVVGIAAENFDAVIVAAGDEQPSAVGGDSEITRVAPCRYGAGGRKASIIGADGEDRYAVAFETVGYIEKASVG